MQAAPKPSVSHDENERFSLTQVNNALLLADRYMDPKQYWLHKENCREASFSYFLRKVKLYLKFDSIESISARVEGILFKISNAESLQCEMNHVWARFIKHIFMNGNVLKINDMRAIIVRTLYQQALKRILATGIEESYDSDKKKVVFGFTNIDRPAIQTSMSSFLGQLIKSGFLNSAKSIHNFLYLAKKVAKSPESGMSIEQIAVTIAPCVIKALHLNNVLCPLQPKADITVEMRKESQFFSAVMTVLLNSNRFDVAFDPIIYADYAQASFDSLYSTIMPTLTDPNRLIDLVNVQSQLKKVRKDPSDYASPDIEAALGAIDEEPLRTLSLSMGKMSLDARRSRNLREQIGTQTVPPVIFSQVEGCASLPPPLPQSPKSPKNEHVVLPTANKH